MTCHAHAPRLVCFVVSFTAIAALSTASLANDNNREGAAFFERRIRPLLVKHCYECHSEKAGEQQGELLLDRSSGWLKGGSRGKAVVPNDPKASLLVHAIQYADEDLQMPPEHKLSDDEIQLLTHWVSIGAPGPQEDLGETEFSRLGDQPFLFREAKEHWAFQPLPPLAALKLPETNRKGWEGHPIDRFVAARLDEHDLTPGPFADARTLVRRLHYDLTGVPPTLEDVQRFAAAEKPWLAAKKLADQLIDSPAFGERVARMWLDVARYADTDSAYRPDTRTAHYLPFAFTYRNYVIRAYNDDKPFDMFLREQLAADLLELPAGDPRLAALGFLTVGPHVNRSQAESLDDWIDVTTRGLMGMTVACARCHDHKFEPIPTADYYSLRGVFASIQRISPLSEKLQPRISGYEQSDEDLADYEKKRAAIDKKITAAGNSKAKNNNRSIAKKIRETELAELLLYHPGAPIHTMVVKELKRPQEPYVFVRGVAGSRGESVPRRFLKVLDSEQEPFTAEASGRLELAAKIASSDNPLTARVYVNRVWGMLMGSYLVATPSDFGLQGAKPTHPELLDWLAADFIEHGWSTKHLVRRIVSSRTYLQRSQPTAVQETTQQRDPENRWLWRANRKRMPIEMLRDSMLKITESIEPAGVGRPQPLWGAKYTKRRAIYGYVNRFNLDPTLRVFDFANPMQTQPSRGESIVPTQSLFFMNSPFVVDQAIAVTQSKLFMEASSDAERARALVALLLQREPHVNEQTRMAKFVETQQRFFPDQKRKQPSKVKSPWPLAAQALMMSNEFQYVD